LIRPHAGILLVGNARDAHQCAEAIAHSVSLSRRPIQRQTGGIKESILIKRLPSHSRPLWLLSWGIRGNGWFANFPGPPPAPPFGGFDPNAGAQFGFAGPNGFLNFTAGQGANTTFTSQAPSVTVMNGQTGFFSDTIQRPFVTSLGGTQRGRESI